MKITTIFFFNDSFLSSQVRRSNVWRTVFHSTPPVEIASPNLSKDWSCPESDKHCLSIGSADHLYLPCFYDVHLSTNLALKQTMRGNKQWIGKYRHQGLETKHRLDWNRMYLFANIIPREVNNRAQTFQHVKDHLSVTTLSRGRTKNIRKDFYGLCPCCCSLPTWKRGTLLMME